LVVLFYSHFSGTFLAGTSGAFVKKTRRSAVDHPMPAENIQDASTEPCKSLCLILELAMFFNDVLECGKVGDDRLPTAEISIIRARIPP
jgi:hypothetical protein